MAFDKATTGSYVPHPIFYVIYLLPLFLNILSLFYNSRILTLQKNEDNPELNALDQFIYKSHLKIDLFMGWVSIAPIMAVNICNLIGIGNTSNDSVFTDYALSCNLIIGAVIILGRREAIVWTVLVAGLLFWDVTRMGWNYEYHYLTPSEVTHYKEGLEKNDPRALKRKVELDNLHLNPPNIKRYFIAWLIYIIISLIAAYFFSGMTIDLLKIIPSVVSNIESGIQESESVKSQLELREKEGKASWVRVRRYWKIIEELNEEIEKLEFQEKKKLINVINTMRKALNEETDHEIFDSIQHNFYLLIQEKFSHLNQEEVRHLMYIRMNLKNEEIAKIMGLKIQSLRTIRYRLKKKLNLSEEIDLKEYIEEIILKS